MKRFRTKPVEVKAVRFDPEGSHRDVLPKGIIATEMLDQSIEYHISHATMGVEWVQPGDWLVYRDDRIERYDAEAFASQFEEC
jgi:sarcosine oxidase gamma subunit